MTETTTERTDPRRCSHPIIIGPRVAISKGRKFISHAPVGGTVLPVADRIPFAERTPELSTRPSEFLPRHPQLDDFFRPHHEAASEDRGILP